jgi:hypothetical protein
MCEDRGWFRHTYADATVRTGLARQAVVDELLSWPDEVREQVARWLTPEAAKPNGRDPHPPPIASMEKASETEGFPPPPARVRHLVFAR